MGRWTGVLNVSLNPNRGPPFFRVAASLLLSPSSKTLAPPSVNAVFFNGDRAEGTGDPVIERISDPRYIAELLVSKLGGGSVNAWVVDASTFSGPFAVYKELVPSVNSRGEPKHYDPAGFPAASSIVTILSNCIEQVESLILSSRTDATAGSMHFPSSSSPTSPPKTVILGFSKGGTVVNQVATELAHLKPDAAGKLINTGTPSPHPSHESQDLICPASKAALLFSISEFHYVDVGLNRDGAYLTDQTTIKKIADRSLFGNVGIRFALHGTPRQWCDQSRPWIRREKDIMRQLIEDEAHRCGGKLLVREKFYFANRPPTLQMHFEMIEQLDVG